MGGPGKAFGVGIEKEDNQDYRRKFERQGIQGDEESTKPKARDPNQDLDLPGLDAPRGDIPVLVAGIFGVDIGVHKRLYAMAVVRARTMQTITQRRTCKEGFP